MLQDMADATSRAAAVDTLERLLAQPHLWARQLPALNPGQDGDAAALFGGGGGWAAAVSELAAKVCEPQGARSLRIHTPDVIVLSGAISGGMCVGPV